MSNNPNYDPELVMPDAADSNSVDTLINRKDDLDEAVDVFSEQSFAERYPSAPLYVSSIIIALIVAGAYFG